MTWICESCSTIWLFKPTEKGVVGCPECGTWQIKPPGAEQTTNSDEPAKAGFLLDLGGSR